MKSSVWSGPLTHPSSVAPLEACREQRLGGSWEKREGPSEVAPQGTPTLCKELDCVVSSCHLGRYESSSAVLDRWVDGLWEAMSQPSSCRSHLGLYNSKLAHLWAIVYSKGGKNIEWLQKPSLQQVMLGKMDSCVLINEIRTHPHTIYKNKLKMV